MRPSNLIGSGLLALLGAACADSAPTATTAANAPAESPAPAAPAPPAAPGDPASADPVGVPRTVPNLGRMIYGLDDRNTLVVFDGDRPGQVLRTVPIIGERLEFRRLFAIDFRPNDLNLADGNQTGLLYGIVANDIVTIDPATGVATYRASLANLPVSTGANTGFGFNPVVDRLRLHIGGDYNVRANVEDGTTTVDQRLAYAPGDVNAGRTARVVATAYTNSVTPAPGSTELFAIDIEQDVLVKLASPNDGRLTTVGRLVVDNSESVGFDISGRATDRTGYATFTPPRHTRSFLYRVNLDDAARTPVGPVGHDRPIISIAIDDRDVTVPARTSLVQDPAGDFVAGYAAAPAGDVDVRTFEAVYDGTNFVLTTTLAGPVGTTPGAFYVFGFNRGIGTARFPAIAPGVLFDVAVAARPDGTASIGTTALPAGSVAISGNELRVTVPASLLPPQGFSPAQYTVNLWPRVGSGNNNQISDFAPDNSNAPVRVTP